MKFRIILLFSTIILFLLSGYPMDGRCQDIILKYEPPDVLDDSLIIETQVLIPGTNDKLLLENEVDPGLYSGFKIIRNRETVFSFNQDIIEIEAFQPILHKVKSDGRDFIILRICGRPNEGWYLIIEQIGSRYKIIGETPPCSNEIFGDIDSDGIFELGLTNPLQEGSESKEEERKYYLNNVKVIELKDNFPVDEKLTNLYVSRLLQNMGD